MNNISEAFVKDYHFARGMYRVTGRPELLTDMERMREAVKVLWPQFDIDLEAAADHYATTL